LKLIDQRRSLRGPELAKSQIKTPANLERLAGVLR
jgi:hypothetical protein